MSTVTIGAEHDARPSTAESPRVDPTRSGELVGAEAPEVTVRYWAGARAAAGVESESVTAGTVGDLVEVLRDRRPALAAVLAVASILVDGLAAEPGTSLGEGAVVEILPPFAGG